MTERLTKERENWIRTSTLDVGTLKVIDELLRELDAVRKERDALTAHLGIATDDSIKALKQVEALTLQLKTARKALEEIVERDAINGPQYNAYVVAKQALADMKAEPCKHENLDMDGICKDCGKDCRGGK